MSALESKQMLKMSSSGTNTRTQTFAPLVNCVIDDVLSQAMPHIDNTMELYIIAPWIIRCFSSSRSWSGRPAAAFRPISCSPLVKIWTVGAIGLVQWTRMYPIQEVLLCYVHCLAARGRSLLRSPAQQAIAVEWEAHHGYASLQDQRISGAFALPQLWHTDGHHHSSATCWKSRLCVANALVQSLFWRSRRIQTIILGIFGHGYILVRKPHKSTSLSEYF